MTNATPTPLRCVHWDTDPEDVGALCRDGEHYVVLYPDGHAHTVTLRRGVGWVDTGGWLHVATIGGVRRAREIVRQWEAAVADEEVSGG